MDNPAMPVAVAPGVGETIQGPVGGIVLALVGVISLGLPILALIAAAICGLMFRRTVS